MSDLPFSKESQTARVHAPCEQCAGPVEQRQFPGGQTEATTRWHARRFCSTACHWASYGVVTRTAKRCPRCNTTKSIDAFGSRKSRGVLTQRSYCKPCEYAYGAELLRTTPKGRLRKRRRTLRRYGLDPTTYESLLKAQGGVCAICQQSESVVDHQTGRVKPLAVDHDQQTGSVRGLLCQRCNQGLGNFREEPAWLRAAATYLEFHDE